MHRWMDCGPLLHPNPSTQMRYIGLLIAMLVLHAPGLAAQTSLAAPMDPRLIVAPAQHLPAPPLADARRDHVAGAAKGMLIGAVVGGLGFAVVTSAGSRNGSGDGDYTLLAIPVGAVVGGAAGLVLGAIIGAPEKPADRR
jgi:hypothetical protein